ncbi:bifunctional histidinol-phosphatase/imidazoleglycerol-phosphate dehydratase HisB [uncultured Muriicola sp.]|uniref:bifunctional histidinol-phosphatase/imidazoleglycerol-phosphate dehydratase HisB n=1 Tax=uncultured Muriicola sp. TaxID=1583102 RepID=UPI002615F9C2|nr:bifunctional histidinol-phosphatase/imidazoleglycerol-phosphate dehydratase HisB [uncultured Muriicola sp.]
MKTGQKKKVLFIDRDGTLIKEPADEQIDSFEKLIFYPGIFTFLGKIAKELSYELVMVTNQDGLGTESYPEDTFWPVHDFIMNTMEQEGIVFEKVLIDKTYPHENAETRKPATGLLTDYFSEEYDLLNSYVIGDRLTDMELAKNMGTKGIFIQNNLDLGSDEVTIDQKEVRSYIALETDSWEAIYKYLLSENRIASHARKTKETQIAIQLNLDGTGSSNISTGLAFFDHMLDQLARHGQIDLDIKVAGDLEVDEHHTIEDTAIALGEVFYEALGSKMGIERYGFCLPMDDCLAQVAIDFGGRNWLVWEADFKREKIGDMPTEMFYHFFKSFTDGAKANLNIKAEGTNEHHKIEAIFKAFAKAIKMAVKRDQEKMILPSTKGML